MASLAAGAGSDAPILGALQQASQSDPAECLEGLRALSKLIFNNIPMKMRVAQAGAVQTITSAMKRFRSEAALQTQGCKTLRQLAFRVPGNAAEIVGSGALAAITIAMRTHGTDQPLLTEALWALLLLGRYVRLAFRAQLQLTTASVPPFAAYRDSEGDEHIAVIDRFTRPSVEAALKSYASNQMLASKAQFLLAMFDRVPGSIVEQPFIHNVPPTPTESNTSPEPGSIRLLEPEPSHSPSDNCNDEAAETPPEECI